MKYFLQHFITTALLLGCLLFKVNEANGQQQPLPYDLKFVVNDPENTISPPADKRELFHSKPHVAPKTGVLSNLWVSDDGNGNYVIKDYIGIQDSTGTVFWLDNVRHILIAYRRSTELWKVDLNHHWVTIHNKLIQCIQLRGDYIWIYGFHCSVGLNRSTGSERGGGCD
ncbi:hypothetical protein [Hymenobacter sp. CRA2]|uniref:hypothetical protein n=1 Tax=Hymenobacter sp. CRA2 TaxID=1955620 RepID=UPI0011172618|nr:hypothetical protein [Hymenobacter sp. CRA2]